MTRQPGAGFAQFFPTAPRVARDRAAEREKARTKTQDVATSLPVTQEPGIDASKDLVDGGGFHADGSLLNGSQHQTDDYGSPTGELVNAVGSASSLTSTSSSTFSVARQNIPNGSSWTHAPTATPLTSTDSPSLPSHKSHPKPRISGPHSSDRALSSDSRNGSFQRPNGSYTEFDQLTDRIPARDPGRSRKGIKCIPNQSADRNKRQSAKPTYKEFGLDDDDAPPPDPRLDENGGHMGYINTDFHLPKSRLRQAPYNLKPYPFNPKTSIGPGPPTQIVVMGFNPLVNFSKVSQIFATFGDIAESSNKMHPETGSYLGFATFQYRDSQPTRSRPVAVKAMDAARRAVRAMQGQKIEAHQIRVEFDPEGRKSRRMLEETLKREKAVSRATQNAPMLATLPTGPKSSTPNPAAGPPPLAPKGPAAQRQSATPIPSGPSKPSLQSKPQGAVEEKPIAPQLAGEPYIHVPGNYVPVMPTTVPHMKKRLKAHGYEDIRVDRTGYYVIFPNTASGRYQAERCFRSAHRTEFFNYEFHMLLCLPPALSGSAESRPPRPSNGRTLSPERKLKAERRPGEDKDRRLREEENDLEEEKRQRAKNFDPVLAACEAVRRELAEHLIKHIRTQVAAPAVLDFLKSDSQAATRRRLNLADPAGSLPTLPVKDPGEDSSRVGTPNSGADPIERRTKHLEVSALPRIRKAKRSDKGFQALGFTDPFARTQRRPARNAFRSLHHRLQSDESDIESDEESDVGASLARETEEPESRPRSRMSTDDDLSKDEFGSWGPREDDSMTEVSLAVSGLPSKKRKLELDAQTAIKRQKKSDEELFGVTLDHIETDLPVHEISQEATPEVDDIASHGRSISRSETPALTPDKALAKKSKLKKKSKKQIFEEREASKKKQETESAKPESLAVPDLSTDVDLVKPIKEEQESAPAPAPSPEVTDFNLFSHDVTPALAVSPDFSLDLASLQDVPLSAADSPELVKLRKKFAAAKLEEPLLWWWQRTRIRELNKTGTSKTHSPAIEGYYVPNSTGCARTEGVKKILNSEKSKYLPHHIKVQKAREAREAKVKDGKDAVTQAPPPAPTKGNSRANRANNRRQVTLLQDELKTSGDPDVFKFNQLKKRKKPVKFARSAIHNWGLYTEENINKDDMIIEYVGEQVRQQISEIREKRYLKQGMGSSYLFRIDDNTVIDATKKGGIARFINHSCMPNCTAKIIKVDGSRRIVIYALRDIARSEELTYDYKFEREIGAVDRIPCLCGTALCKGFLN